MAHHLRQQLHPLELRSVPRLMHRAYATPACRRPLPLHPQAAARPLRPNGISAGLRAISSQLT
ncbi:hypothetical protein [Anabaena sp. CCY 9910]|uniref:hypothetical protein n=1 Tax=Anabaena sp. CCY 9910 TaxID=3103870 RepID=UPI0039E09E78